MHVKKSRFEDHLKSVAYKNIAVQKLSSLYNFFPPNYFEYSHASLIFVEQADLTGFTGTKLEF